MVILKLYEFQNIYVLKHGKAHPIIIVIIPFDPAPLPPSLPVLVLVQTMMNP